MTINKLLDKIDYELMLKFIKDYFYYRKRGIKRL